MVINTHDFQILPALHLAGGKSLDFTQDEPTLSSIVEQPDPLQTAQFWVEQGARWIHVIDVDASFDRDASHNWPLIEKICELPVKVQYGGGIRSPEDIEWAIRIGVERILINTAAVENPQLISQAIIDHGSDRLALAMNTNAQGTVFTHGWKAVGGMDAVTLGIQMRHLGITTVVHSFIDEDGMMSGADLEESSQLAQLTGLQVIVGGKIRDMDDVVACYNQPGISGILIGKALHSGKIDLRKALKQTSQKIAFESGLPRWKQEQTQMKAQVRYALSHRYLLEQIGKSPTLRALDAGGGNGMDSLALARFNIQVDLVDRSCSMLQDFEQLQQQAGEHAVIKPHNLDLREIKQRFVADSFDLVLCHNVIQYDEDWRELLLSIIQPLKSGGLLSLITRNQCAEPYAVELDNWEADQLPDILDNSAGISGIFDSDLIFFTEPFLRSWLDHNGFEVIVCRGLICLGQHPAYLLSAEDWFNRRKLETLEYEMGRREPYRQTARYLQLIARKI